MVGAYGQALSKISDPSLQPLITQNQAYSINWINYLNNKTGGIPVIPQAIPELLGNTSYEAVASLYQDKNTIEENPVLSYYGNDVSIILTSLPTRRRTPGINTAISNLSSLGFLTHAHIRDATASGKFDTDLLAKLDKNPHGYLAHALLLYGLFAGDKDIASRCAQILADTGKMDSLAALLYKWKSNLLQDETDRALTALEENIVRLFSKAALQGNAIGLAAFSALYDRELSSTLGQTPSQAVNTMDFLLKLYEQLPKFASTQSVLKEFIDGSITKDKPEMPDLIPNRLYAMFILMRGGQINYDEISKAKNNLLTNYAARETWELRLINNAQHFVGFAYQLFKDGVDLAKKNIQTIRSENQDDLFLTQISDSIANLDTKLEEHYSGESANKLVGIRDAMARAVEEFMGIYYYTPLEAEDSQEYNAKMVDLLRQIRIAINGGRDPGINILEMWDIKVLLKKQQELLKEAKKRVEDGERVYTIIEKEIREGNLTRIEHYLRDTDHPPIWRILEQISDINSEIEQMLSTRLGELSNLLTSRIEGVDPNYFLPLYHKEEIKYATTELSKQAEYEDTGKRIVLEEEVATIDPEKPTKLTFKPSYAENFYLLEKVFDRVFSIGILMSNDSNLLQGVVKEYPNPLLKHLALDRLYLLARYANDEFAKTAIDNLKNNTALARDLITKVQRYHETLSPRGGFWRWGWELLTRIGRTLSGGVTGYANPAAPAGSLPQDYNYNQADQEFRQGLEDFRNLLTIPQATVESKEEQFRFYPIVGAGEGFLGGGYN